MMRMPLFVPSLHKYSARMTVLFQVPEMGMTEPEFLSRATVFSVVNPQGRLNFFTPHHVVAPWRYPKYHAEQLEWLQYVREKHCTYRVDVKSANDRADIVSCTLGQLKCHPSRDAAMLSVTSAAAEVKFKEELKSKGYAFEPLTFRHEQLLKPGELCTIAGYEVEDDDLQETDYSAIISKHSANSANKHHDSDITDINATLFSDSSSSSSSSDINSVMSDDATANRGEDSYDRERADDFRIQYPFFVKGALTLRTQHQAYVRTTEILTQGMCGSPALDDQFRCCGMVEGMVPLSDSPEAPPIEKQTPLYQQVQGNGAIVEADVLYDLMVNTPPQHLVPDVML